jgi:hypothetical protein
MVDMVYMALAKTMVATMEVMAAMAAIALAVMVTAVTTEVLATNG